MKAKKIRKLTVKKGGYTDKVQGRYIVAIKGFEKQVPKNKLNDSIILEYKRQAKAIGNTFGTWLHNGVIYLDNVQCFESLEKAMEVARNQGEIAIYDSLQGKEITC